MESIGELLSQPERHHQHSRQMNTTTVEAARQLLVALAQDPKARKDAHRTGPIREVVRSGC